MGLRSNIGANEQFVRNIQDAQGWQDSTESSLDSITQYVNRAHDLLLAGRHGHRRRRLRKAIAAEIDQIIQGVKETANANYGDKYIMSGTATSVAPYQLGDDDTYQGDLGGLDPAMPGIVREIGPGVTMTINSVAVEILGDGRTNPTDGKLLNALRDISDHLKANDGAALRGGDMTALQNHLDGLLDDPRPQRRADQPPRRRQHAPRPDQRHLDRPALEHRGRRHRQDADRLQLAERRLPGRTEGRREHRAVVAHGFPPLSRYGL